MTVVVSFVLCVLFMYVYQDGDRDIKKTIVWLQEGNLLFSFGGVAFLDRASFFLSQEHWQLWF